LSQQTSDAWFLRSEVLLAIRLVREGGHRLVPVRIENDAPLPHGLESLHVLEAYDDVGLVHLRDAIVDLVRHPNRLPPPLRRLIFSGRVPVLPRWFVGRDDLLRGLAEDMSDGGTRVLTQTINGMGGVGKTMVAAAFARRFALDGDLVWWVRAEQAISLVDDLLALADRLGLPASDDRQARAELVVEALATTDRRWLLVFDNAVDDASIAPWIPNSGAGHVLVTTRNRNVEKLGAITEIGVLSPAVAARFLRDRVRDRNPAAADEQVVSAVVARLQGLPLALEQAAAWVARSKLNTYSRFLVLVDDASRNPYPDDTVPLGYERTTWDTWQVSIAAATAEAPLADKVLRIAGWLASDGIRVEWLESFASDEFLASTPEEVRTALAALEGYSLLQTDGLVLAVHRVGDGRGRMCRGPPARRACDGNRPRSG
jgi:hypothetical protein